MCLACGEWGHVIHDASWDDIAREASDPSIDDRGVLAAGFGCPVNVRRRGRRGKGILACRWRENQSGSEPAEVRMYAPLLQRCLKQLNPSASIQYAIPTASRTSVAAEEDVGAGCCARVGRVYYRRTASGGDQNRQHNDLGGPQYTSRAGR